MKLKTKNKTKTFTSYLRSDLRDQQPEILAPVPSSRVISDPYDKRLSSGSPVAMATTLNATTPQ